MGVAFSPFSRLVRARFNTRAAVLASSWNIS